MPEARGGWKAWKRHFPPKRAPPQKKAAPNAKRGSGQAKMERDFNSHQNDGKGKTPSNSGRKRPTSTGGEDIPKSRGPHIMKNEHFCEKKYSLIDVSGRTVEENEGTFLWRKIHRNQGGLPCKVKCARFSGGESVTSRRGGFGDHQGKKKGDTRARWGGMASLLRCRGGAPLRPVKGKGADPKKKKVPV